MSTKIAGATFALGLLGLVLPAPPAAALDPDNWMRFPGTVYASQSDPTERAFVREWEADAAQGLSHTEPGQRGGHEGSHQALQRQLLPRAAGSRCRSYQLQSGSTDPAVAILLQRLLLSGDLREEGSSEYFDYYVDKAVRALPGVERPGADRHRRQAHHRRRSTFPAAARLKQLKVNLERLSEPGAPRRTRSTCS